MYASAVLKPNQGMSVQTKAGIGTWDVSEVQRAKPPVPAAPADLPQRSLRFPRLFLS